LLGWAPALALDSAGAGPKADAVRRCLRVLGGGEAFAPGVGADPSDKAARYLAGEPVFLDGAAERSAVAAAGGKEHLPWPGRKPGAAVVDAAVRGRYEPPPPPTPGPDVGPGDAVLSAARAYHVKDGTYQDADVREFEEKLKTLLPGYRGAGAAARP